MSAGERCARLGRGSLERLSGRAPRTTGSLTFRSARCDAGVVLNPCGHARREQTSRLRTGEWHGWRDVVGGFGHLADRCEQLLPQSDR